MNFEGQIPKEVTIQDKTAVEQINLIQQLDDEDRKTVFTIIDKMLTNKNFKDFFAKKCSCSVN